MIIYKDVVDKTLIKTSVRLNKSNQLELFFYDDHKTLNCFTFAEGHNEACLNYMYSCKAVDQDTAEAFLLVYNSHCNDDKFLHVFSKRLSK